MGVQFIVSMSIENNFHWIQFENSIELKKLIQFEQKKFYLLCHSIQIKNSIYSIKKINKI